VANIYLKGKDKVTII